MTMIVVARLLDMPQAQVAASALRSAGLHPVLFEEHQNTARWYTMYGVGGCRVAVPEGEAEDAVAVLDQPPEPEATAERLYRPGWAWRLAAGLFGIGLLSPELGWFLLGVRARSRDFAPVAMGFVLATVTVVMPLMALTAVILFLSHLLQPNAPY